jgi:hypothetical protein
MSVAFYRAKEEFVSPVLDLSWEVHFEAGSRRRTSKQVLVPDKKTDQDRSWVPC